MIDYVRMLKEFHFKYGHHVNNIPTANAGERIKDLRLKLMQEELNEIQEALDLGDLVKLSDGIADLLYVTFGTAVSYGIPIDEIFTEIHKSNMTKSMEKDTKSVPGKTLKGNNYVPPKIDVILNRYLRELR